jgi:hypothetical protein
MIELFVFKCIFRYNEMLFSLALNYNKLLKLITMIKNILFTASLLAVGAVSAQTFQFNDHNDVDIANTVHYEYGTPATLAFTKFHVENLTATTQTFAVKAERVYVPYSNSDLAICFGTDCFSALANVSGVQTINGGSGDQVSGGAIYSDLKISPVTWPWVNTIGDSAVWNAVIYKQGAPTDSVAVQIVYKFRLTGDTNGDGVIGVGEIAGDDNGNGVIDGGELAGDVNGDGSIGSGEKAGDNNGDGDLDSDDWPVAVDEIDAGNITLNAYPNPATDNLTVVYNVGGASGENVLKVYDVLGQEIVSRVLNRSKGSVKLDLEAVNSGVYFYAIKIAGKTVRTERFIVR